MYKDTPIVNRDRFKLKFHRKHGKFKYLPELIFMIEKYQHEKYENLVDDYMEYAPGRKGKLERR